MNFNRIVVGTDLSASSFGAIRAARKLAAPGATLDIVYSTNTTDMTPFDVMSAGPTFSIEEIHNELSRRADDGLAPLARELCTAGFDAKTYVRGGRPADEILSVASLGAELVVVGSHGRGFVSRMCLGSVAEEVVRRSSVPVLIVHGLEGDGKEGTGGAVPDFGRVVVAVDLVGPAHAAIKVAGDAARTLGVPLEAIHAVPLPAMAPTGWIPQVLPTASEPALARAAELARAHMDRAPKQVARLVAAMTGGIEPPVHLIIGPAGREIPRHLRPHDLLVCGTHRRMGMSRFLFGSVATRLVRESGCSVLLVPPDAAPVPKPSQAAAALA